MVKHGQCRSAVATRLQNTDEDIGCPLLLRGDRQAVALCIVQTYRMQVPDIGIGNRKTTARRHSLHTEHQTFFFAETTDISFASGQRTIDDTHDLVGFMGLGIESIIRKRTLKHDYAVGIVLVVIAECAHLFFGNHAHACLFSRICFPFVLDIAVRRMSAHKIHQCFLGSEYKYNSRKQRRRLFFPVATDIDRSMCGDIDLQYIL